MNGFIGVDEDLHSLTMRKLFASDVLISGMHSLGLGVEIAKNLILAGVKSVTLHDEGNVKLWDLSGKNRAVTSVSKLQEFNKAVLVLISLETKLTKERISNFKAVVFTDISLEKAIEFNDYYHSHLQPPIAFIKSEVRGLLGSIFWDFGPEFTVLDVDGDEAHAGKSCDERFEFQDRDLVVFSHVQEGMTELNDGKPRKIRSVWAYSFTLEEDPTNCSTYETGGIVTQPKKLQTLSNFLVGDSSKFDRPPLLHLAFQALDKFVCELGHFPLAGSEDDAPKKLYLLPAILMRSTQNLLALWLPWTYMVGGIVGQEVVKTCSGKFLLRDWNIGQS